MLFLFILFWHTWAAHRDQNYLWLLRLPRWLSGKEPTCQCSRRERPGFDPWVLKIPWRRKWQPTPVFLLGKSHGQRRLAHGVAKSTTWLSYWAPTCMHVVSLFRTACSQHSWWWLTMVPKGWVAFLPRLDWVTWLSLTNTMWTDLTSSIHT